MAHLLASHQSNLQQQEFYIELTKSRSQQPAVVFAIPFLIPTATGHLHITRQKKKAYIQASCLQLHLYTAVICI